MTKDRFKDRLWQFLMIAEFASQLNPTKEDDLVINFLDSLLHQGAIFDLAFKEFELFKAESGE